MAGGETIMETSNYAFPWLGLIDHPAFCVKDDMVIAANSLCTARNISVGSDMQELLQENFDTYKALKDGQLYLTVYAGGIACNATVTKAEGYDIFTLCSISEEDWLSAYALASQQLRIPLSNVMAVTDRLLSELDTANTNTAQKASQINRGLFQLLRIVSNMSDASLYLDSKALHPEAVDFTALFAEILEKAQSISEGTGITLHYSLPKTPVLGLAYPEQLERAVYNLLSNAIKFSPADGSIEVNLAKSGNRLVFTVLNNAPNTNDTFWNRYRREPAIEDSRNGLGLGMTLVGATATAHGGTVLLDHPTPEQTRVTLTIPVKKPTGTEVRSPKIPIGDYAGGRDKGLLEFSEFLPTDNYKNIN